MTSTKSSKSSDYIGFRSKKLYQELRALIDANPGRIKLSDVLRAAVEEKLERLQRDPTLRLKLPSSYGQGAVHEDPPAASSYYPPKRKKRSP